MNGVLNFNKDIGPSSGFITREVGRLLGCRKAGHMGTLDPFAAGVLPICVGEATKLNPYISVQDKVYEATIHLGRETDTLDCTGNIMGEKELPAALSEDLLRNMFAEFLGKTLQTPPIYSAKKINGRPSYKWARQGKRPQLQANEIEIFQLELLNVDWPQFSIRVHCSKGTYIRALADDMGRYLGCGGHLSQLSRLRHGPFLLAESWNFVDLQKRLGHPQGVYASRLLVPMSQAIDNIPAVSLPAERIRYIREGQKLTVPWLLHCLEVLPGNPERIQLTDENNTLVALIAATPPKASGVQQNLPKYQYLRVFN